MKRLAGLALLMLAACASGPQGHPHGHGHRDSPGRAAPSAVPLPGYEYRFRPDPQGLGRDLPPLQAWGAVARVDLRFDPAMPDFHGSPYSERVTEHRETARVEYRSETVIAAEPGSVAYEAGSYGEVSAGPSTTETPYVPRSAPPSATEIPYAAGAEPSRPTDPNVFY